MKVVAQHLDKKNRSKQQGIYVTPISYDAQVYHLIYKR